MDVAPEIPPVLPGAAPAAAPQDAEALRRRSPRHPTGLPSSRAHGATDGAGPACRPASLRLDRHAGCCDRRSCAGKAWTRRGAALPRWRKSGGCRVPSRTLASTCWRSKGYCSQPSSTRRRVGATPATSISFGRSGSNCAGRCGADRGRVPLLQRCAVTAPERLLPALDQGRRNISMPSPAPAGRAASLGLTDNATICLPATSAQCGAGARRCASAMPPSPRCRGARLALYLCVPRRRPRLGAPALLVDLATLLEQPVGVDAALEAADAAGLGPAMLHAMVLAMTGSASRSPIVTSCALAQAPMSCGSIAFSPISCRSSLARNAATWLLAGTGALFVCGSGSIASMLKSDWR